MAERDDYQYRLDLLRARVEATRLATRLKGAELALARADEENRALRESIAFGIGRALLDALRSPRQLLRLPLRLAGLARLAKRRGGSPGVPPPALPATKNPPRVCSGSFALCADAVSLQSATELPTSLTQLRIAGVMDVFSAESFAYDCELTLLRADTWPEQMRTSRPHLLLVESSWQGPDRTWEGLVSHPSDTLRALVRACRDAGIPTVFWNKEDPLHYEAFIESAALFDCVFTTDADCIPRYRHDLGHERVYLMPFALQPALFHPVREGERSNGFFFAGAYYPHLVERSRDFRSVVDTLALVAPVHIYDRNHAQATAGDLAYPADYRRMLRGGVDYAGIAELYRSYRGGININTIKQSPTMFARRVLELIGCGCAVYGNYSAGIIRLFGQLVVATDDPEEMLRQSWNEWRSGGPASERRRAAALRKALAQHTYADRLSYLARKVGFDLPAPPLPAFAVLARATTAEELASILSACERQSLAPALLLLDVPASLRADAPADAVLLEGGDLGVALSERLPGMWVAPMCADDHYGRHYLQDLALATRYSRASAIGKAAFRRRDSEQVVQPGMEYRPMHGLALRRAAMASRAWQGTIGGLLDSLRSGELRCEDAISIDALDYIEGAAAMPAPQDDACEFDEGVAMEDALAFAESMPAWTPPSPGQALDGERLVRAFRNGVVPEGTSVALRRGRMELCAKLPPDMRATLRSEAIPAAELVRGNRLMLSVDAAPERAISYAIEAFAADGSQLERRSLNAGALMEWDAPARATAYRLVIEVCGIFTRYVDALRLGASDPPPLFLPGRDRLLMVTNAYPRAGRPYRNGFVHRRVLEYRRRGVAVDVVCVSKAVESGSYAYDGVQVHICTPEVLRKTLKLAAPRAIAVHFLDRDLWEGIREAADHVPTVVWLHGAEIQAWSHRACNYVNDAGREQARREGEARSEFWRTILSEAPANLRLVFVSQRFAEETWRDLGIDFPRQRWRVIHNPIDDRLFAYAEKPAAMRNRILSVRPHDSRIYANDLVAEVIRGLSVHPEFTALSFHLVGDGALFEANFAGLEQFSNVLIERRLLPQEEVAALHREYGVFLVPTRGDTQGVSRDEAMASGLVPVTSRAGAVEEFVSDEVAILTDPDDVAGMVQAIRDLVADPGRYCRMSRAAAARVRAQSGAARIIREELAELGFAASHAAT